MDKIKDPGYHPKELIETLKKLMEDENKFVDVKKDISEYFLRYLELIGAKLLIKEPFYGQFLVRTNRNIKYNLPHPLGVSIINGNIYMYMNPIIIMQYTPDEFMAMLKHEFLHIAHSHLLRAKDYKNLNKPKQYLINISMDCAINQLIEGLPKDCVTIETISDIIEDKSVIVERNREYEYYLNVLKSSKKVKDELKKYNDKMNQFKNLIEQALQSDESSNSNNNNGKNNNDNQENSDDNSNNSNGDNITMGDLKELLNGTGDMHETWDLSNALDKKDMNIALDNILKSIIQSARGRVPSYLQEIIKKLTAKPIISWQQELRNMIGSVRVPYMKTLRKRSRRLPDRLDIPGKKLKNLLNIAIAIDTSGSVSDKDLDYIFNEIFNIVKTINYSMTIIECDAKIGRIYQVKKRNDIDLKVSGRGGTAFTPVFEWLYNLPTIKKPDILIYFTDGYGEYHIDAQYKPSSKTKLMWVLTGQRRDNLSVDDPFTKRIKTLKIDNY